MSRRRVLLVLGTRPEVVKLAPVHQALSARPDVFEVKLLVTGQHREMLHQALDIFALRPDYDLDVMRDNQDLYSLTANVLTGVQQALDDWRPDLVLVQGDTTTTFVGSLAAYYARIPVGHVEAGLRTGDKYSPFPEEVNRMLTGCMADLHFAPTDRARDNLRRENVAPEHIHVTGNTSIDAIQWVIANTEPEFDSTLPAPACEAIEHPFVLITTHRRESFGEPMQNTFEAIVELASRYPAYRFVFPVHLNPNVRDKAQRLLGSVSNVVLLEPLDYIRFSHLMDRCRLILSDSGGVQEEAPSLNKPVLVLRETTERQEGIDAGTARLVGTDRQLIVAEASRLIDDEAYYQGMVSRRNPYGDGRSAERIADILERSLQEGLR